jgi:predicted RNase H-like HicB family nuclease
MAGLAVKNVVVYEQTPTGCSAYFPGLPGCVAASETRDETECLIREAIVFHLEGLRESDEPIPEPGAWTETVEVLA